MTTEATPTLAELTTRGGPFEIAEQEINGVRMRVYQCGPHTLREVLELSRAHLDRDYLVYEDERYTFADNLDIVAGLADYLATRFGVGKGDRVAIAMRNYPEFVFHWWAALALGAIAVPLNAWWTEAELAYGLADCAPAVLVVDDERLTRAVSSIASSTTLRGVISVRSDQVVEGVVPFTEVRAALRTGLALPEVDIDPDDLASILYTSGTTGSSRGAMQSHRNHCTNVINTRVLGSAGFARQRPGDPPPPQVGVAAHMPLFHISALGMLYLSALTGGKVVLMYKWDTEHMLELIERERLNSFSGVPMQAQSAFESPSLRSRDLSSLRTWGFAGTAVAPELVLRVREVFGGRVVPRTGYGMTEATSAVTFITGDDYWAHPDSVGRPSPVSEVRIVDPDGVDVAPGEAGEIWVKGPNIVRGYCNQPEATASAFTDGWHHTGDVARRDEDGRLYIVDRIKDIVIRAGENVYCGEVEAALYENPAVRIAVVFGLPHERLGEEVSAVVRLAPGFESTSAEDLAAHAAQRLAAFKVPSRYVFVHDDLPRTATGKIVKREVRQRVLAASL